MKLLRIQAGWGFGEAQQQRQAVLATTVEEFCRNISAALDNPSFETKQKILRLVVERIEFVEDQITIKHVIPVSNVSNVRLQRHQHNDTTPTRAAADILKTVKLKVFDNKVALGEAAALQAAASLRRAIVERGAARIIAASGALLTCSAQ